MASQKLNNSKIVPKKYNLKHVESCDVLYHSFVIPLSMIYFYWDHNVSKVP